MHEKTFDDLFDKPRLQHARVLLHRWMVLYNPFYFLSALSLLSGIYLIAENLEASAADWTVANLALIGVLHGYEVCLILIAAWLCLVKGLKRPAVLLGLLECLFLLDPTFFTHVTAHLEPHDRWIALLWAVLVPLKVLGLCWALELRIRGVASAAISLCLGAVAIAPTAFDNGWIDAEKAHAGWIWGLSALFLLLRRLPLAISSVKPLDDWGQTVLRRAVTGIHWGLPIACLIHLVTWISVYEIEFPTHWWVPILLSSAWVARKSIVVWSITFVALKVTSPAVMPLTALLLGLIFVARARREQEDLDVLVAALLFYLSAASLGWSGQGLPSPAWWVDLGMVIAMIALAWRYWQPWFLMVPGLRLWVIGATVDLDPTKLGIGLAVSSFVTLALGTWVGARLARDPLPELPTHPPDGEPSGEHESQPEALPELIDIGDDVEGNR